MSREQIEAEELFWRYATSLAAQAPAQSWATYSAIKAAYDRAFPSVAWRRRDADMARIARLVGV